MTIYAFGPFVLEAAERRLTRDGRRVALPGKAWQLLVLLAESGGRLVPHEILRAKLWPNIVVEDRTLTVHVSTLRKALGAGAYVIETVTRVGYRLSVPVRLLSAHDLPSASGIQPPQDASPLAVSAFLTPEMAEAESYLGVGIADAVATTLGEMPGLAVSPVGAVDDLAGARRLGLAHLLEGVVRRKAQDLQVSARLIDVASGRAQWSEQFTRPHAEGAVLQEAIAARVAQSLAEGQSEGANRRNNRPSSPEAYFLQLEARANMKPFARLPLLRAMALFEQALALDPNYAIAHAGLASAYLLMASTAMLRPLPVEEAMPLSRRSAERAIALDDGQAEAWAVLGRVKMEYDWDWDGAEADLAHAVTLNPSSVEALSNFAGYLSALGRHDEAIQTMERALQLDPRRVETLQHLGIVYWMAGRPERALEAVSESLRVAPGAPRGHYGRMLILDQLGRRDEAMVERLTTLRGLNIAEGLAEHVEQVARSQGWRAAMEMWIGLLERTNRWEGAAMQWMAAGDKEKALEALERCIGLRTTYLVFTGQSPCFSALRDEPRFQKILQTLKLDTRLGAQAAAA